MDVPMTEERLLLLPAGERLLLLPPGTPTRAARTNQNGRAKSPMGVTLPESPPTEMVLARDCYLACEFGKCSCILTCELILAEHGIDNWVYYAGDGSGALLYLRPADVEMASVKLGWRFPLTCAKPMTMTELLFDTMMHLYLEG